MKEIEKLGQTDGMCDGHHENQGREDRGINYSEHKLKQ